MASGASGKRLHLMFKYVHDCKDNEGKSNVVDKQQTETEQRKKTAINCIWFTCASVYD